MSINFTCTPWFCAPNRSKQPIWQCLVYLYYLLSSVYYFGLSYSGKETFHPIGLHLSRCKHGLIVHKTDWNVYQFTISEYTDRWLKTTMQIGVLSKSSFLMLWSFCTCLQNNNDQTNCKLHSISNLNYHKMLKSWVFVLTRSAHVSSQQWVWSSNKA